MIERKLGCSEATPGANPAPERATERLTPPASLFKYFGPEGGRFFENWLLRFSQGGALNDPFEFSPPVASWGTQEEVAEHASEIWEKRMVEAYSGQNRSFRRQFSLDQFLTHRRQSKAKEVDAEIERVQTSAASEMSIGVTEMANAGIGVLCLCECPDELLMWAHYGMSHTGFVVEFDTTHAFFQATTPPQGANADPEEEAQYAADYGYLRPVQYMSERNKVILTSMSFGAFEVKGACWQYEREWRMFMPLQYATVRGPLVVPNPVCLWSIPPFAIRRVIVGARAGPALVERVRRLRDDAASAHIAIEIATVDREHFRVNFEPLLN